VEEWDSQDFWREKRGSGVDSGTQKRGQEHSGIIKPNDLLLLTGHAVDRPFGWPSRSQTRWDAGRAHLVAWLARFGDSRGGLPRRRTTARPLEDSGLSRSKPPLGVPPTSATNQFPKHDAGAKQIRFAPALLIFRNRQHAHCRVQRAVHWSSFRFVGNTHV
jgi:hypothetical protein